MSFIYFIYILLIRLDQRFSRLMSHSTICELCGHRPTLLIVLVGVRLWQIFVTQDVQVACLLKICVQIARSCWCQGMKVALCSTLDAAFERLIERWGRSHCKNQVSLVYLFLLIYIFSCWYFLSRARCRFISILEDSCSCFACRARLSR